MPLIFMHSSSVHFQVVRSGIFFRRVANGASIFLNRFLDLGKPPGKSTGVWMIDNNMFLQFSFGAESEVDSRTAGFCTAEWLLVSVDVIITADAVRKAFVEMVAGMTRAFVPIFSVILSQLGLLLVG
jgi:hypothetical protein